MTATHELEDELTHAFQFMGLNDAPSFIETLRNKPTDFLADERPGVQRLAALYQSTASLVAELSRTHHEYEEPEPATNDDVYKAFDRLSSQRFTDCDSAIKLVFIARDNGLSRVDTHHFLQRGRKYDETWVDKIFDSVRREGGVGLGTLYHYLKQDVSEELYHEIRPQRDTLSKIAKMKKRDRTPEQHARYEKSILDQRDRQLASIFSLAASDTTTVEVIGAEEPYVLPIPLEGPRVIGIKAGLGRGKTTQLIALVAAMPADAQVVILSPRISYAINITAEYNRVLPLDQQFVCYRDLAKMGKLTQLKSCRRVMVSMESMHHLGEDFTPDLLIIDEVNACLVSHLATKTNGQFLDDNITRLKAMLDDSTKVVFADAFLGTKAIGLFEILKIPIHVLNYECRLTRRRAVFHPYDLMVQKLREALEDGRRVYAYISTKKKLEAVQAALGSEYASVFYSGTSESVVPGDLNEEWVKYQLVATTATITVGISQTTEHFDSIFIDFQSCSKNLVSDAIQAHYRIRNLRSNEISVFANDAFIAPNHPVKTRVFRNSLNWSKTFFTGRYSGYEALPAYLRHLLEHNHLESGLSESSSTVMLKAYLTDCNYKIVVEEPEKKTAKIKPEVLYAIDDPIAELVKDFPHEQRVKELMNKKAHTEKLTPAEESELDRHQFSIAFAGGAPTDLEDPDLPVNAIAYQIWKTREGPKLIKTLRLEKSITTGKTTVQKVLELRASTKTRFAELADCDIRHVDRMNKICKSLGLAHANDTRTVIPHDTMTAFYEAEIDSYSAIQKDLGCADKRANKKAPPTFTQWVNLMKVSFTKARHSICHLVTRDRHRVRVGKSQVRVYDYQIEVKSETPEVRIAGIAALVIEERYPDLPKIDRSNFPALLHETLKMHRPSA